MTPDARIKFNAQKQDAKRRGVDFRLTPGEWWAWWQLDNRWARRGRGRDQLVMARHGDCGAYELGNIYPATHAENMAESAGPKRSRSTRQWHATRRARGIPCSLAVRGAGHPNSRAVITPIGRYESGALAADALGVSSTTVYNRVRRGDQGYRWEWPEA